MSIASWTSPRASAITFPISRVISCASSSLWSTTSWAKRKRISPRLGAGTSRHSSNAAPASELRARDLGDNEEVVRELGVPVAEHRLELLRVVAALGEPDGLGGVGGDPVLVPGDVPGERDHDVAVHARQRDDADAGLA